MPYKDWHRWRREHPTKPGFYWFWSTTETGARYGEPTVIEIHDPPDEDGNTWVWWIGFETASKASDVCGMFHIIDVPK